MLSKRIILLTSRLTIRICKEELLFKSIKGVDKLLNFKSFNVIILFLDI